MSSKKSKIISTCCCCFILVILAFGLCFGLIRKSDNCRFGFYNCCDPEAYSFKAGISITPFSGQCLKCPFLKKEDWPKETCLYNSNDTDECPKQCATEEASSALDRFVSDVSSIR